MESRYLGDGVYATYINDMIRLTTGNHQEALADNVIWLEPEVAIQLGIYIDQTVKEYQWKRQSY